MYFLIYQELEQACVIISLNKFSIKQKLLDWVYNFEGAVGIRCPSPVDFK